MKNKICVIGFLMTALLSGCGGGVYDQMQSSSSGEIHSVPQAQEEMASSEDAAYDFNVDAQRDKPKKIIVTADLYAESKNFDQDVAAVKNISPGGYFESSDIYSQKHNDKEYRVFRATLKVPSQEYEPVRQALMEIGNLKSLNESTEDVSEQYYDSQARLDTKKIEEAQILKLIEQAVNIEDILALEQHLAEVRLSIEMYTENIVSIDRLTAYSTIHLEIQEVQDYSLRYVPADFGSKLLVSLQNSYLGTVMFFQNAVVFITGLIIPLLLLAAIATVVVTIRKNINRIKTRP